MVSGRRIAGHKFPDNLARAPHDNRTACVGVLRERQIRRRANDDSTSGYSKAVLALRSADEASARSTTSSEKVPNADYAAALRPALGGQITGIPKRGMGADYMHLLRALRDMPERY
jgi:hypothetical protein